MDKLDPMKDGVFSKDILEENVQELKKIFPEVVTEGKIDFEKLKETLGKYIEDREERYNFTWNGKSEARRLAQTLSMGTLRPCPGESVDWEKTENLFIEGDNLEVLKLLQKSYHKKVKMIYIDPPYNTGSQFIYPDDFRDNIRNYLELTGQTDEESRKLSVNPETSGRYHTDWLNMMYPRLKLASNLLRDDGVIFISIDENELINLQRICEEIFGENNVLGNFPVVMNLKGNQDSYGFAETHEYFIVCLKNKEQTELGRFDVDEEVLMKEWLEDEYGLYKEADNLRATGVNAPRTKRPNLWYPIFLGTGTKEFYITDNDSPADEEDIKILPMNPAGEELSWYWSKKTFNQNKHNLILKNTANGWQFYRKQRPQLGDLPTRKPKSFFYKSDYSTSTATTRLKQLFGAKIFDSPKPVPFLFDLGLIGATKDSIILDFFAGSATTAHAVLDLNKEDCGNRKFIMVQLPELCDEKSEAYKAGYKTIADIGKERIRRVIKKIKTEEETKDGDNLFKSKEQKDNKQPDLGFKVFKLDSSNIKPWEAGFDNLGQSLFDAVENIKPERSEADVLYELLLKYGLDLTVPIERRNIDDKRVHIIGAGALIVCLADEISLDVVEGIAKLKDELKPELMRVVFKDAGFEDDVVKTNTVQILRQHGIEDVKSI